MDFDINTLRSAATVASLFTYIGIVVWAWSRRNLASFQQAANLPFEHEPQDADAKGSQA